MGPTRIAGAADDSKLATRQNRGRTPGQRVAHPPRSCNITTAGVSALRRRGRLCGSAPAKYPACNPPCCIGFYHGDRHENSGLVAEANDDRVSVPDRARGCGARIIRRRRKVTGSHATSAFTPARSCRNCACTTRPSARLPDEPVLILHGTTGSGAAMLSPALRRRAVRPRPAAGREQVLHHPAGRHRHRKIVQTFRRPARQVSQIQLRRHGRRAIQAGDRRPGHPPSAPGAGQLDGRHAHLDLGRELSGLSWMRWCPWRRSPPRCPAATG